MLGDGYDARVSRHPSTPGSPRIFLLGMMGSGKSTVGRALSRRTGWPFVDNDELVRRATGRTARELVADGGETALRSAESAALAEGIAWPAPAIVAVAAGVVLDEDDRRRLADIDHVVWLTAPPYTLAGRAAGAAHRPWLEDDPLAWFASVTAERDPLYREVADLVVDTSRQAPEDAAAQILASLG